MFYEELKKRRESAGIALDQISNKIKVSKSILEAFEKGDFSKLPVTYVRLFLKAYANELGANPEKILSEYEAFIGKAPEKKVPETRSEEPSFLSPKNEPIVNGNKKRNVAAITIILVILVFLISVLKQVLMEEEKNKPAPINAIIKELPKPVEEADTTEIEPAVIDEEEVLPEPEPEILSLVMITSDTCWVRVVTDENDTTEANYLPNIRREWTAEKLFDVRVGRPTKVRLTLNNKPLGPIGKAGIPTRLIISKDGIIRSTLLRR